METQTRRHQPYQRRPRIYLHSGKVAVFVKISFALVTTYAQPIVHRLHRQLNIFRSLQLNHYQAAFARDTQ